MCLHFKHLSPRAATGDIILATVLTTPETKPINIWHNLAMIQRSKTQKW